MKDYYQSIHKWRLCIIIGGMSFSLQNPAFLTPHNDYGQYFQDSVHVAIDFFLVRLRLLIIISMEQTDTGQKRPQSDCIVCLELADQALITNCCTAIICYKCFGALNTKPCPKCRKDPFMAHAQQFIRKFLMQVSPSMTFFVKTLTGSTITLTMKEFETARMLYNRVHERQGMPFEHMMLVHAGKNIALNDRSLKSLGIQKNANVHVLGRLKGGDSQ